MNKQIGRLSLALVTASMLYAGDIGVNVGFGAQNITDFGRGTVGLVGVKKEFQKIQYQEISGKLSVEAEYTSTMSKPEDDFGNAKDIEASVNAFAVYGVFSSDKFNNTNLYARVRAGLVSYTAKVEGHGISKSNSEINLSGGVGLGYTVNPQTDVVFDITSIEQDVRNCTFAVQYKF